MTRATVEVNGKALAEQRRNADMSQQQLADKAGVSRLLIWRAESGRRIEAVKIEAIAKALGVSPRDLRMDNGGLLGSLGAALEAVDTLADQLPHATVRYLIDEGTVVDTRRERERWGL